jgi:glycosyltransferase involved in cell wall biosynthesis
MNGLRPTLGPVRLAVYTDAVLRCQEGTWSADETFVVFVAGLRDRVDRLVLIGRVDPEPGRAPYRIPDDVEVASLPHYASLDRRAEVLRSAGGALTRFWRVLDRVDVVWLLGPHPLALLFAVAAAARRRRVVLGVRQDMPAHIRARHPGRRGLSWAASALEWAWRGLTRLCPTVVVGPDLARRYRHARSLLPLVVSLVDDGDLVREDDAVRRSYAGPGPLVLLSVGRLDPEKNPLMLARVLSELRAADPRWHLVVCGDGTQAGALAGALREHGADGHAELLGFVPLAELRQHYRNSHALLHVSWTEGVPQILFEAFAAGLPVVATDVGGVAEAVDGAAVLVPPGAPGTAAEAVARLAADPVLRCELVHRGLAVAGQHTAAAERRRLATFLEGPVDGREDGRC